MRDNIEESHKKKEKFEELGIETILELEVRKFGTSAHIPVSKKFIGRKVAVIIPKE